MTRNRKNNRLKDYDYSQCGYYYVTVCTENQKEYFGEIRDSEMILNEYGVVLTECWRAIPDHFDSFVLDELIIMPNHIHGILIINTVGNRHACSLQRNHEKLPLIIGVFKSAVTKKINSMQSNFIFGWQKSYYDRVIRDEQKLLNIRQYIMNTPLKADVYKKENLSFWRNDYDK